MSVEVSFITLQKGHHTRLKFSPTVKNLTYNNTYAEFQTEEICIADVVKMRFKFEALYANDNFKITTSISMMTPASTRDYQVTLKVTGKDSSQQWVCSQMYTSWIVVHTNKLFKDTVIEFDVAANKSEIITFAKLYYDNDVTDFNLNTAEGSVAVHKACLTAHSDVFKRMFSGSWKENETKSFELKGVTMKTLIHLKEYLYLGTIPDSDLEPLFLVARCYLIESLQQRCLTKMAQGVSSKNLYDLIGFACENNVPELVIMLFQYTKEDVIYDAQEKPKPEKK